MNSTIMDSFHKCYSTNKRLYSWEVHSKFCF